MSFLTKIFGDANEKVLKKLQPIVDQINALEKKYEVMSDEELKQQTVEFRKRLGVETPPLNLPLSKGENTEDKTTLTPLLKGGGAKLDEILPEAFAVVREAAKRTLAQRHFDVQLLGGIVLHQGQIAEMKTGEGKTLVATLPAYLNGLAGHGVHIVTVNDYLAKRDTVWMGQIYDFLGLSVGCINHEISYRYQRQAEGEPLEVVERRQAYDCDILYGTNNEFGFDFLRDNMAPELARMAQRQLNYAIVDEVDSILIDEARTPLIISAPAEESTEKYYRFAQLIAQLKENEDYNVDEKMHAATLSEAGISKMEKWLGVKNIYELGGVSDVHQIEQALKARVLFKADRDYVVKEGQVIIVDEFTGRLMYGRRYSEGLHQAIEAKESVEIQRESQTLATITFQNYFRMYSKLAGMTGTAATEAEEFAKIYNLETVVIPTNKPMVRQDLNDLIYRSEASKFKAVAEEVKRRHQISQPVLVGTISIEKNELLGQMLEREGIKPQVLNAKHHEQEASVIAQAGKLGAVTIATNMAGRGVDIVLGGSPSNSQEQKKVIASGGLHVIGTERHEARRIDNQLRGRTGRQGDPGSSQFYVSMEDDLMRIFGGERMKSLMTTLRVPEDLPIENRLVSRSIEAAQKKVEGYNFDIRKHLVEYDDVINKHREAIYKRRREILEMAFTLNPSPAPDVAGEGNNDVILEGAERPTRLPGELASGQVESRGQAGKQRDATVPALLRNASRRVATLQHDSKNLTDIILEMVENEIEQVIIFHTAAEAVGTWNLAEIYQVVSTIFPVEEKLKQDLTSFTQDGDSSAISGHGKLDKVKARTAIIEHLVGLSQNAYQKLIKQAQTAGLVWPEIEKAVLLRSIDMLWVEHLEAMDHLRQGIGLRGYGQRDPLVEYKKEAYKLYNELNNLIQKQVVYSIFKVGDIAQFRAPTLETRVKQFSAPAKEMSAGVSAFSQFKQPTASQNKTAAGQTVDQVRPKPKDAAGKKVGRNDPCPCGSGKKYKKCHGK